MKKLFFSIVLTSLQLIIYAQFQNSSLPERLVPVISTPNHIRDMTCYSYGDLLIDGRASDLYVTTNNEGLAGVHYKRTLAGNSAVILDEGLFMIPGAHLVKDAVILKNPESTSPNEYVVAAIYTNSMGSNITFLEWTGTGLVQTINHLFSTNSAYFMKMDALALNYYAVVYELDGDLYSFCGATNGLYPVFGPSKLLLGNASSGPGGTKPDIAMTELPRQPLEPIGCNIKIYYTYIDLSYEECIVSSYQNFCNMFSPFTVSLNLEHIVPPINPTGLFCNISFSPQYPEYLYSTLPRIDAPDKSEDSWSVIVQQEVHYQTGCIDRVWVNAAYKINGGPIQDLILNDGSQTNTVSMDHFINGVLTTSNVAVAFDKDNTLIHYGWGKTQAHAALGDHDYIGLLYNTNISDVELGVTGDAYRIIDYDAGLIPYIPTLAFSGQNIQINNLYTVFVNSDDYLNSVPEFVYDKHPLWGNIHSQGYRPSSTDINQTFKYSPHFEASISPNPFTDQLRISLPEKYQTEQLAIRIVDITGSNMMNYEGSLPDVNSYLASTLTTLESKQVYILHITLSATQETVSYKIIKE